jgi:signal transduction histidine kinase
MKQVGNDIAAPRPVAPAPAAPRGDPAGRSVLAQIRKAEFASMAEVVARFSFIAVAGGAIHVYTGQPAALAWAATYLGLQVLHYGFLVSRRGPERRWEVAVAHLGYGATAVIFVSFPVALLLGDDPVLVAAAAFALATLVVFLLWRPAPPRSVLPIDVAVHGLAVAAALAHFLPALSDPLAQAIVLLCALAEVSYFTMALYSTTAVRHRLGDAALRGIEAQKMEAIGRLTGGIAHDFNNILTVMRGNLELYAEVADPAERARLVAEAHAAALRASGLVSQLLSFSRRAPLAPVGTDAQTVIAELAAMAARVLPARIRVELRTPPAAMPFRADLDRLNAALLNLVINARDAIAGQGRIVIEAAPADPADDPALPEPLPPGRYLRFSVTDDGPGLSPEAARRALEPFYTTKPVGQGSGLGLPSAKGFAEQSGGGLTIRSRPGETVVSIYLPQGPA